MMKALGNQKNRVFCKKCGLSLTLGICHNTVYIRQGKWLNYFDSYSLITGADNGLVVTRPKAITWTNWWWMSTIASLGHNEWSVKGTWYAYIWHIKPHLCVIVLSFKSWYASHYLSYKWHHIAFKVQAEYVLGHPCVVEVEHLRTHLITLGDMICIRWIGYEEVLTGHEYS